MTYHHRIWVGEPEYKMNNGKVVGTDDIPIEVWKCIGE